MTQSLPSNTLRRSVCSFRRNSIISGCAHGDVDSLVSGSWDRTLKFWDPKSKSSQATSSHTLPERIYHMDLVGHTLVVAMASRLFQIWDVRNMQSPVSQRESSLKYMTRAVACMSDQKGPQRSIQVLVERPDNTRRLCHGLCRRTHCG